MFIDTHTHYYDEWLRPDADEAIVRAVATGVGVMIQADVDSREREAMFAVAERHPGVLYNMLGLYPGSVRADWEQELSRLEPWRSRGIVAVGEIGLDYHEGREFEVQQRDALRAQFELAAAWDLPVSIHLRDAAGDFLQILADCAHLHLRGVLHCFTGSYETFLQANRHADFSVGIGGVVTFRNASLAETVRRIPLEKIVLETDCPYLAPVPWRGRRNESAYLPLIAEKVALQKGLTPAEVETATTYNARKLFGL